jgi:hypothetical protein
VTWVKQVLCCRWAVSALCGVFGISSMNCAAQNVIASCRFYCSISSVDFLPFGGVQRMLDYMIIFLLWQEQGLGRLGVLFL